MNNRLIFISYSHADEVWKDLLEKQLGALERADEIEVWTDREIGAGEDWYKKIEDSLKNAWVAILLISDNSLTSDFILREEVTRLLKRRDQDKLRIVPIIVRDCPWKLYDWLNKMQVRPRDGRALEKMRKSSVRTELMNIVFEIADMAKTANPIGSESRGEAPERARPEPLPKGSGADPQRSLQDLKAERDRILSEYDQRIGELEGRSSLRSQATSGAAIGDQQVSAKQFEEASQTTSGLVAQVPEGEVNAKKEE